MHFRLFRMEMGCCLCSPTTTPMVRVRYIYGAAEDGLMMILSMPVFTFAETKTIPKYVQCLMWRVGYASVHRLLCMWSESQNIFEIVYCLIDAIVFDFRLIYEALNCSRYHTIDIRYNSLGVGWHLRMLFPLDNSIFILFFPNSHQIDNFIFLSYSAPQYA